MIPRRRALTLYTQTMFTMLVWVAGEPYTADTWAEVERIIGRAHHNAKPTVEVFPRYSEGTYPNLVRGYTCHFFGALRKTPGRPFGEWDGKSLTERTT